jgi:hypothetical protein
MSNDDPFTLDLFNTTTLSSGLGLGVTAFGGDFGAGNSEDGASTSAAPAVAKPEPVSQPVHSHRRATAAGQVGENFFLERDRGLAKGWKQRASDNLAAIRLAADIGARAGGLKRGLCFAGSLHPVRPLHARVHRPGDLGWAATSRLARGQGARTRDRHRPVSGSDAGWSSRPGARHRRRARPGDGQDRPVATAAGAHRQFRLPSHRAPGRLRPRRRQSAVLRSHRPLGSRLGRWGCGSTTTSSRARSTC